MHGGQLLRFGYLLCGDGARAEDLVQDALVKLMRRWRAAAAGAPARVRPQDGRQRVPRLETPAQFARSGRRRLSSTS